ncbi:MAG: hypothetical protein ACLSVU_00780 [Christensenellales bacterium]
MSLLCVLTASPRTLADVHLLSRRMLAMRASADALLALCDLPDAFAAVMPEDEPLLRALQSAVMAADARAGRFLLLVRRRVWDDASRLYLGESQPISPVQTVSALLDRGQTQVSFAAASFSPASLAGQFSSVLFCPADVSCAPDVLPRMSAALDESVCSPRVRLLHDRAAAPPAGFSFGAGRARHHRLQNCADFRMRPARFRKGVSQQKKPRLLTPARSGLKPLSSPKTRPPCNGPFGRPRAFSTRSAAYPS